MAELPTDNRQVHAARKDA